MRRVLSGGALSDLDPPGGGGPLSFKRMRAVGSASSTLSAGLGGAGAGAGGGGGTAGAGGAGRTEAWVVDAAQRLLVDVEKGSAELAEIVLRQAATRSGEQLRRALGVTSRKLQELARSRTQHHRRACVSACEAILHVLSEGTVVVDEPSIVKDYILSIHRALGYSLKLADTHEEVEQVAAAMGTVLTATAVCGAASEIAVSLAYQSSEWLCSGRPYHQHAGAVLCSVIAEADLLHAIIQHVPTLIEALPKAFGADLRTIAAVAAAAGDMFSCLSPTDPDTLAMADSFLSACMSSLTRADTNRGAFMALAAMAWPLQKRCQNHVLPSLSVAMRCAVSGDPAAPAAVHLIGCYVREGFVTPTQASGVLNSLLVVVAQPRGDDDDAAADPFATAPPTVSSSSSAAAKKRGSTGTSAAAAATASSSSSSRARGATPPPSLPPQPQKGSRLGPLASIRSSLSSNGTSVKAWFSAPPDANVVVAQRHSRGYSINSASSATSGRSSSCSSNGLEGGGGVVCDVTPPSRPSRQPSFVSDDPTQAVSCIPSAFKAISAIFESGLVQELQHCADAVAEVWEAASETVRRRGLGAEEAAQCLAVLCAAESETAERVGATTVDDVCLLPLTPTLAGALATFAEAQPRARGAVAAALLARAEDVLSEADAEPATLVGCLKGLLAAGYVFDGVESERQLELAQKAALLLRQRSSEVKTHAAELCCFLAAGKRSAGWAQLLLRVLSVAVADPLASCRMSVWFVLEKYCDEYLACLSAPQCSHCVCLSLFDVNYTVRRVSLHIAVRISATAKAVPPRLRAALLVQWNQLQHSHDPLEQARAASAFSSTHAALLKAAPHLMPSMLRTEGMVEALTGILHAAVPMVQTAIFELLSQLLLNRVVPVSASSLTELEETAVLALIGSSGSSATKPAAQALAAIVRRTGDRGAVVLQRHEGLLPRLIDCLKGGASQETQDVRIAIMKLLGALGALAPLSASKLLQDEAVQSDDLPWGRGMLNPRYHSFRVVRALLTILQKPRLRVHHIPALRAILPPLKLLGMAKVIQLSKELLPVFIQVAEDSYSEDGNVIEMRVALKTLHSLLEMIQNNIDPSFLADLMKVCAMGIQLGEASALAIVTTVAEGLGPAFMPAVESVVGTLTGIVSSYSEEVLVAAAVRALCAIGPALLRPYVYLVSQHLCLCITKVGTPLALKSVCIEAASRLIVNNLGGHEVAPAVLHALLDTLSSCHDHQSPDGDRPLSPQYPHYAPHGSSSNVLTSGMAPASQQDVWFLAVQTIGEMARSFRSFGGGGLSAALFTSAKKDIEASALSIGVTLRCAKEAFDGTKTNAERTTAPTPRGPAATDAGEDPYNHGHAAVRRALQGFGAPSLWLDNLAQTLLGESPRAALCAASPVARGYPKLAHELFGPAFVSLCSEPARIEERIANEAKGRKNGQGGEPQRLRELLVDSQATKAQLLEAVNQVLSTERLSGDVSQRLLCLAEYYERYEEGAQAGTEGGAPKLRNKRYRYMLTPLQLCKLAERSGLYAKALHWAEAEVLAPSGDDVEACISLVKAYKNSGIEGAEEGALAVLEERGKVAGQETRLQEDLGKCGLALERYRTQGDTHGIIRCLDRLGDWRGVLAAATPWEDDPVLAPYTARASWVLGDWATLSAAAATIEQQQQTGPASEFKAGQAGLGQFYLAVVSTHNGDFKKAREAIQKCRLAVDHELAACLAEGYTRSYDMLVSLQQLVELEEIIEFKETVRTEPELEGEMLTHLKRVWKGRLEENLMDPASLRGTLTQRSLLVAPQDDPKPWLWFIKACTHGFEKKQAWDTLTMLAGSEDVSLASLHQANMRPEVILAVLSYEQSEAIRPARDVIDDALRLAKLCESSACEEVQAECLVKAAEWGHAAGYTWEMLVGELRPAVRIAESSLATGTLKESVTASIWQVWATLHSKVATDARSPEHAVEAMRGFINCAKTSSAEIAVPMALRLLRLVFLYASSEQVQGYAKGGLMEVSASLWLRVVPQLVARLGGECTRIVEDLLCFAAVTFPHTVVYSLLPHCSEETAGEGRQRSRHASSRNVMQRIQDHSGSLVVQAEMLARELSQAAILEAERWRLALEDAYARTYNYPLDVLKPFFNRLRELHTTLDRVHFMDLCGATLLEAEALWMRAAEANDTALVQRGWALCNSVYFDKIPALKSKIFRHGVSLNRVAPSLAEAKLLPVLPSKTCPKRLTITDNHGVQHDYLLKGHEDLRLDERVMQLLGLVNGLLRRQRQCKESDIVRFSVVPLGSDVGLLGWVADADDLGRLVRAQRHRVNKQYEVELVLRTCSIGKITQWESQPQATRVAALQHVGRETDGDDIHRYLWLGAPSSETWIRRRTSFCRSLAAMSIIGYVLGLGDRHMGNIMLQKTTGHIVHIDFGDCFDVARERKKFAEKVPFRLTRQLRHATGVGGVSGLFRHTAESTMYELRKGKELVMAMLEAFVYDPLMQWRLAATDADADADADTSAPPPAEATAAVAAAPAAPPAAEAADAAGVDPAAAAPPAAAAAAAAPPAAADAAAAAAAATPSQGVGAAASLTSPAHMRKPTAVLSGLDDLLGEEGGTGCVHEQSLRLSRASVRVVPQTLRSTKEPSLAPEVEAAAPSDAGPAAVNAKARVVVERLLKKLTGEDEGLIGDTASRSDSAPGSRASPVQDAAPAVAAVASAAAATAGGSADAAAAKEGGGGGSFGRDKDEPLSVQKQVERLVDEATHLPNLADSYRGWEPWL